MNYLISLQIFFELLMRFLMFIWSVCRSVIWCFISAKQKQCSIICIAISLIQSHWQTENSILSTHVLFKNITRSILSVLIWIIIAFFVLWKTACCLTTAYSDFLIFNNLHSNLSVSHYYFHLLSNILNAEKFFWYSFFNHVSAHWVLTSSSICIDWYCSWHFLLYSLLCILRHAFLIRFFMSNFLCLSQNCVSLAFRYKSSRKINISVFNTEIRIAW